MGMNIVTVIHQPRYSVFSLFHEVLLLGKAGRTVFQVRMYCRSALHACDCHIALSTRLHADVMLSANGMPSNQSRTGTREVLLSLPS